MFNAVVAMPKLGEKSPQRVRKRSDGARGVAPLGRGKRIKQRPPTGGTASDRFRFETVMEAAERSGLLKQKSSRIAGRVSPSLVQEAKRRTGIEADTDLIAFALANVALEDKFAEAFKDARGKIDPDLKLGF
jgi:hypothetical protein